MRELSVALVGGGFMGKAHSLAMAVAPYSTDIGAMIDKRVLVDVDEERATRLAAQLGWRNSSASWREAVARPDVDIVDICTPPQFHEEIALAAIDAGKHVFCEKPITNDAAGAIRMRDAAEAAGVVVQVGCNYRHAPAVAFTKQLLDSGRLGEIMMFRGSYCQETGFGSNPHRWRATKATGGSGTVGDIGSHIIDMGEYLCGDIVRVAARIRGKATGDGTGWTSEAERIEKDLVDEGGVWVAEFADGTLGTFAVTSYASGRKNRVYFELDASKGAVEFDWNNREIFKVSYVDEPKDHRGFRSVSTNTEHPYSFWGLAGLGTGYVEVSAIQFQRFVRAIVSGVPTGPDFRAAAHVQQVVEAIQRAAVSNEWVDVPRSLREDA